jgi:signal transduction histidine kinase
VILGLLLLTTALLMLAIYVLRREHALARLRSDFIARVSHELRTPLTQIRMFTETLLLGRVRSRQEEQRSLEIMDREVRRLSHLVENILQFSRGERGAIRLAPQSTELGPLVEEMVERFRPLALRRDVHVTTQLQGKVTATVDTEAMCQIILNLLDNALNYGPAGQEIRVGLTGTDTAARITIEDQGPGIPRKERQKIWDRFNRLERDERAAIAGTGIGLTVVRELVGLQGGRVWVDSRHGEGARFVVEMPRQLPLLPAREKGHVGAPGTLEPAPGRTDSTG